MRLTTSARNACVTGLLLVLSACGGGGGGNSPPTPDKEGNTGAGLWIDTHVVNFETNNRNRSPVYQRITATRSTCRTPARAC